MMEESGLVETGEVQTESKLPGGIAKREHTQDQKTLLKMEESWEVETERFKRNQIYPEASLREKN